MNEEPSVQVEPAKLVTGRGVARGQRCPCCGRYVPLRVGRKRKAGYDSARQMRQDGRTLKEIAQALGVSITTVYNWTRDIQV